jgi:hypothetical protein
VAGSFLPVYGPLPPSTTVVPSEVLKPDGSVDDRATADLLEIALPVTLSRQQILEEDLSSALLQFRRRATQLGQLEDWFIFNGTYPSIDLFDHAEGEFAKERKTGHPDYRPDLPYLDHLTPSEWAPMSGTPRPIAGVDQIRQRDGRRQRDPGSLGLIGAPRVEREHNSTEQAKQVKRAQQQARRAQQQADDARQQADDARQRAAGPGPRADDAGPRADDAQQQADDARQQADDARQRADDAQRRADDARKVLDEISPLDDVGLMQAIVRAINSLEENGYVAPYVCVFGRNPFEAAYKPINQSTVLPRDRIEPLIGRELLHASGIDVPPKRVRLYVGLDREEWRSRGVLLSMADESIDLALAAEATPEFRQVDLEGRYVFSVFERFALRIKDANAVVPLRFETPQRP